MATRALRDWVPEEDDETLPDLPANTQKVLDGDLDQFIEASLKQSV